MAQIPKTPPGHWNTLANTVADDTNLVKRIGGVGPVVNDLEWGREGLLCTQCSDA